ncbi:MAG TPA: hypothetical protein VGA49_03340 [Patescibacteria group bacterium]
MFNLHLILDDEGTTEEGGMAEGGAETPEEGGDAETSKEGGDAEAEGGM